MSAQVRTRADRARTQPQVWGLRVLCAVHCTHGLLCPALFCHWMAQRRCSLWTIQAPRHCLLSCEHAGILAVGLITVHWGRILGSQVPD